MHDAHDVVPVPIPATNGSLAGAFNILDTAIVGSDRVFALTGALTPPITFLWAPDNTSGSFFDESGLTGAPEVRIVLDTGGLEGALTVSLQLQAPAPGTNADGTNIDAVLLTIDNELARDTGGNLYSQFLPGPETNVEVVTKRVPPGKHVIRVHGRPTLGTGLTNSTSNSVTYTLICQFTPLSFSPPPSAASAAARPRAAAPRRCSPPGSRR